MKFLIIFSIFLICSCNINNPIPKYTDIIVTEKQTNTLMKFNGKVSLNNINKYGDTDLFVDNITECRYSIDSLIVCDQKAKKDTFSIFINEVWCLLLFGSPLQKISKWLYLFLNLRN